MDNLMEFITISLPQIQIMPLTTATKIVHFALLTILKQVILP